MQKPPTATFFEGCLKYCTADVLTGGVGEVEVRHQVVRFVGGRGGFAPVEVRHECPVASFGEPIRGLLDLIV